MRKQLIVVVTIAILVALFAVAKHLQRQQRAEQLSFLASENARTFVPAHAISYGPEDARVIVTDFFDPACETCAQLYRPVKKLVTDHPGQVRVVMRHAPFHQGSDQVVKMLLAAREQGKYWETLELVFSTQHLWTSDHVANVEPLWGLLPQAGIDVDRLKTDMANPALDTEIAQDLADARTLGVRMTPEYFVNGKPLPTWGYEQLVALVDSEVALQYPAR